ncbi:MAG TPA: hypothetical protein VF985_05575, partial [Mariniflexile sp.]
SEIINKSPKSKFLAHLHELDIIIKQRLPNLKDYLPVIDHFIVPSKLVETNLIANWSVSEDSIEVV